MLLNIIYVIFLYVIFGAEGAPKLPSYLKICHRTDPNLEKCIIHSVDDLRPLLKKGIPELDIPSCEPLKIPEVVIDQGSGSVSLKSVYKDILVYGPSKFIIKSAKLDFKKDKMRIKVEIPHLDVKCNYTMDGRILMMPISGKGTSRSNYSDIEAIATIKGDKIKIGNDVYYNVNDFDIKFNIGKANIQLDDLFNGDKDLGEAMNLFLNDNWKQIANEIKPVLEDNIALIFKRFANKIFHKYPLSALLPE